MLRTRCEPARRWRSIESRIKDEKIHLQQVAGTAAECRLACERTANCNGFRMGSNMLRRSEAKPTCQLFTGCPDFNASESNIARRDPFARWETHWLSASVRETAIFPLPGVRRTIPTGKPSGLWSFESVL